MVRRRPSWLVAIDSTTVDYGFFVSHVREDEGDVRSLKSAVERFATEQGESLARCFLDLTDWPDGRISVEVIREYLARSVVMVAWITPRYLEAVRGWQWIELAYADLIEVSLNWETPRDPATGTIQYVVPLFRGVKIQDVERTPWINYWTRQFPQLGDEPPIEQLAERLFRFCVDATKRRGIAAPPPSIP